MRGLLLGTAAVGLPALANAWVARGRRRTEAATWGRLQRYAWTFGEIAYARLGDGPNLVLLHSFGPGHDAEEWRQTAEILAESYRVFAPDLLGWGRSDKPGVTYDAELYLQLLGDFLSDVVREPTHLVAAGLPGAFAVQLAVDRPEVVTSLALVSPYGVGDHGDEPDLRDALVHRALRLPVLGTSALNLTTSRTAIEQHLRRQMHSSERVDAALVDHYYRSCHQPGSHRALAAYLCGYLDHPVADLLPRLDRPPWIAWGRHSVAPPVESADLWLRHRPDIRLEVVEDAGAAPHQEVPGRFAAALSARLALAAG